MYSFQNTSVSVRVSALCEWAFNVKCWTFSQHTKLTIMVLMATLYSYVFAALFIIWIWRC